MLHELHLSCKSTLERVIFIWPFHLICLAPFHQISSLELEFILDIILIRTAPVLGSCQPALIALREFHFMKEIINRGVFFHKPCGELVSDLAISIDVTDCVSKTIN